MIEFCKCGSIFLSSKCTNKNCDFKPVKSSAEPTIKKVKEKKPKAAPNPRKSSKCVTYKIGELLDKESSDREDADGGDDNCRDSSSEFGYADEPEDE